MASQPAKARAEPAKPPKLGRASTPKSSSPRKADLSQPEKSSDKWEGLTQPEKEDVPGLNLEGPSKLAQRPSSTSGDTRETVPKDTEIQLKDQPIPNEKAPTRLGRRHPPKLTPRAGKDVKETHGIETPTNPVHSPSDLKEAEPVPIADSNDDDYDEDEDEGSDDRPCYVEDAAEAATDEGVAMSLGGLKSAAGKSPKKVTIAADEGDEGGSEEADVVSDVQGFDDTGLQSKAGLATAAQMTAATILGRDLASLHVSDSGIVYDKTGRALGRLHDKATMDSAGDVVGGAKDTAEDVWEGAKDTAESATNILPETVQPDSRISTEAAHLDLGHLSFSGGGVSFDIGHIDIKFDRPGDVLGNIANVFRDGIASLGTQRTRTQVPRDQRVPRRIQRRKNNFATMRDLEGGEVVENGRIIDAAGILVGRLIEGDAEDLAGYLVGVDGEILDADGDVVGRAEPFFTHAEHFPDKILNIDEILGPRSVDVVDQDAGKRVTSGNASEAAEDDPDSKFASLRRHVLHGHGHIFDEEGVMLATLVAGDIEDCVGAIVDNTGSIVNEKGRIVGKVALIQRDEDGKRAEGDVLDAVQRKHQSPSAMYDHIQSGLSDVLAEYEFAEEMGDVAVKLDNCKLMLKHWLADTKVREGGIGSTFALANKICPEVAQADQFVMQDIALNVRRLKMMVQKDDPLYNCQVDGVSRRIERGVKMLAENAQFHRELKSSYWGKAHSEVRTVRAEMDAFSEAVAAAKEKEKKIADVVQVGQHLSEPSSEESAVRSSSARRTPSSERDQQARA